MSVVDPVLKDIRTKKQERIKEFLNIETQIAVICAEIAGNDRVIGPTDIQVDEQDLTAKRLGELKSHLQELQSENVPQLIFLPLIFTGMKQMTYHFNSIC